MGKKTILPKALPVVPVDEEFSPRRHRRKHKKHRHRLDDGEFDDEPSFSHTSDYHVAASSSSQQPSIKLKIKIGGQTVSTKSVTAESVGRIPEQLIHVSAADIEEDCELDIGLEDFAESYTVETTAELGGSSVVSEFGDVAGEPEFGDVTGELESPVEDDEEDDDDNEESKWLDALEAGNLNDNGELRKERSLTAALTARQRALLHGETLEDLMQLPSGYKQVNFTEEQIKGREIQASKRKQLAIEKTEKHKKDTVDRLLKKQEAKARAIKSFREKKHKRPMFTYINNISSITVAVPLGFHFPFAQQIAPQPKPVQMCGIKGCTNPKKYSCSKSGLPLCSLECYRRNRQNFLLVDVS